MNNFNYWPRYVARVLRINALYRGDYLGWKVLGHFRDSPKARDFEQSEIRHFPLWDYSESYPWNMANRLSSFPYPDMFWTIKYPDGRKVKGKLTFFDPNKYLIFKGDRVKVLIGHDKGKIGIISSIIKMRNLVFVESLNCFYKKTLGDTIVKTEFPLHIQNDIALIDPQDNNVCEVEWRYDESGNRVRVSKRTGRIIPIPIAAESLDDNTIPSLSLCGPKDTVEEDLTKVTYKPVLRTFTQDILEKQGIKEDRVRAKTYWY